MFVVQQSRDISWVNFSRLEFALQVKVGKVGKVASFVGKIFVVRPSTTKTTNILSPRKFPSIYVRYYDLVSAYIIIVLVYTYNF